ncbi:hypothetical protein ACN27G_06165 [Plantactinospora sp. WMMB334]|uniref:hypothetical protein n=1 Tax=Plantactinospora sp. WMMB334 TaxID=3404119 RepID=UPI003B94304F
MIHRFRVLLGWLLSYTAADRCTLAACRRCLRAGRDRVVQRRLWHLAHRRRLIGHSVSIAVCVAVYAVLAAGAAAAGLPAWPAAFAISGVTLALIWCWPTRWLTGQARTVTLSARRLDPDTPIASLPDDSAGEPHRPVPDCCVDCNTELALDAERPAHRGGRP